MADADRDGDDELSRRRDAVLAAVAAGGVLGAAAVVVPGGGPVAVVGLLTRPTAFAAGVAGALLLELGFAVAPRLGRALWRRQRVRLAGTATVGVGLPAVAVARPAVAAPVLAALFGGLVGYAALLVGVTAGVVPSPETWLGRDSERERHRDDETE